MSEDNGDLEICVQITGVTVGVLTSNVTVTLAFPVANTSNKLYYCIYRKGEVVYYA